MALQLVAMITAKNIAKKILPPPALEMLRGILKPRPKMLLDIYKTGRERRVLLSYITEPFLYPDFSGHTNYQECRAIAEVFHELGYCVDVMSYDAKPPRSYARYECIFGFGDPFCASFRQNKNDPLRIHYATGAHVVWQNEATLQRAEAVHHSRGVWLMDSCRIVDKAWPEQTTLPDAIIALGGEWVAQTYRKFYSGPVFTVSASFNVSVPEELLERKNFAEASRHFFWFGSRGAIHKGLDLLLEAFAMMPDYTLHIAGPLDHEPEFMRSFAHELARPNILIYGFVDVFSDTFSGLMQKCAFAVLPSCSEGSATSLLNTMCNGLIPVMTPVCGIDPKDYGVAIDSPSLHAVEAALSRCMAMPEVEIRQRSKRCFEDVRESYDLATFKSAIGKVLHNLLLDKGASS